MRILALLGVLAIGAPAAAQAPVRSPDALAHALQRKYDAVRDLSADFVHVYEGGALRMQATERGVVQIKKPGKMRWAYRTPEEKLFVSDGQTIYAYVPADNQVRVGTMPADDDVSASVLFLLGRGNLTRDFVPSHTHVEDAPDDTLALKLMPIQPDTEYESLTLVVDRESLALRQLVSIDQQGGTSTFRFTNLKENVGVSDAVFAFTIPHDADVITGDRISEQR